MRERDQDKHILSDAALDDLFAEARQQRAAATDLPDLPDPLPGGLPPGLNARILAQAGDLLESRAAEAEAARAAQRAAQRGRAPAVDVVGVFDGAAVLGGGFGFGGFWAQLSRALGGAPALAGLGAVTIAGLWLGLMPPQVLQSGVDGAFGTSLDSNPYLVDSATAFDFLESEG